mgnify:CR=1 FL=1
MGILNALFGGYGRNDDDDDEADIFFDKRTCTRCGSTMQGDGCRFECPECGVLFLEDGEYLTPDERMMKSAGSGRTCDNCGKPLRGGQLTLPWENGGNPNAFVRCPHCGYSNIQYGFGEDD